MEKSTIRKTHRFPPRYKKSPNKIFIWNLSKYLRLFLMDFPFGGFGIVAMDSIVEGRNPELTILAFVGEVIWVWL